MYKKTFIFFVFLHISNSRDLKNLSSKRHSYPCTVKKIATDGKMVTSLSTKAHLKYKTLCFTYCAINI